LQIEPVALPLCIYNIFALQCDEIREIITHECLPWLSQYLVMKRVSIEFNFHSLYSNFLDCLNNEALNSLIILETFRNIRVNITIFNDILKDN